MALTNPTGWLPYGSSDPSVLFYDPLTSTCNTVAAGGRIPASSRLLTSGGGGSVADIVHDSVLGMKAYNDGTKYAAYRFQTFSTVGAANPADLQWGGQITFEIETSFLTNNDANSESTGASLAATQGVLSATMGAGVYRFLQRASGSAGAITWNVFGASTMANYYTGTASVVAVSSWGRDRFTRVNVGWNGGKVGGRIWLALDDQLIAYGTRNQSGTGTMTDLFIGSQGSQTTIMSGHYMRNLQVATRPPMFPIHERLTNIVIWGDSQVKDVADGSGTGMEYNVAPAYNSTVGLELAKELGKKGLFARIATRGYSGYSVATDGTHTSLSTTAATIKALNPQVVLLEALTNDAVGVGGVLYAGFEADFKALVVDMLSHQSVEFIGLRTCPSTYGNESVYDAQRIANVAAINAIVAAMPDYIDANYPQYAGRVDYIDSYTRLGGESPPAGVYYGQLPGGKLAGARNNLHYAALGCQIEGQAWAELVLRHCAAA